MKLLIIPLMWMTVTHAQSVPDPVSAECQSRVESRMLKRELNYLSTAGEKVAGQMNTRFTWSKSPGNPYYAISVLIEDDVDGRFVRYNGRMAEKQVGMCKVSLRRKTSAACRFSTTDGERGLALIPNLRIEEIKTIQADDKLSSLEKEQVRKTLRIYDEGEASISELIRQTDDEELIVFELTLSTGEELTYYKYYAGDTAVGILFRKNTAQIRGDNSDETICIAYAK